MGEPVLSKRIVTAIRLRRWRAQGGTTLARSPYYEAGGFMFTFLMWCFLFILCWPLALLAIILYPLVWLLLLPFRLMGIAVEGVLELVKAIIFLPARVLRGPSRAF